MLLLPRRIGRYLPVLVVALTILTISNDSSSGATNFGTHRTLLLTAHPDDECMFFAPTILSLVQGSLAVYSLCLSIGNAEGLGNTRKEELRKSLQVLGIPSERSQVVNHPLLQDNFTQEWSAAAVAEVVRPFIIAHNITAILTFDEHGISQHPNHMALLEGVSRLLTPPSAPAAKLFTLRTVPLFHKYIGLLSHLLAKLWLWSESDNPTFIAGFRGYLTALQAMYQHQSQLVWFRWLYVLFSRYMWVNDWVEVRIQ